MAGDGSRAKAPRGTESNGESGPGGLVEGGGPRQPHPGTHIHRCGCSLPGLTGFTVSRCEGTDGSAIESALARAGAERQTNKARGGRQATMGSPACGLADPRASLARDKPLPDLELRKCLAAFAIPPPFMPK